MQRAERLIDKRLHKCQAYVVSRVRLHNEHIRKLICWTRSMALTNFKTLFKAHKTTRSRRQPLSKEGNVPWRIAAGMSRVYLFKYFNILFLLLLCFTLPCPPARKGESFAFVTLFLRVHVRQWTLPFGSPLWRTADTEGQRTVPLAWDQWQQTTTSKVALSTPQSEPDVGQHRQERRGHSLVPWTVCELRVASL